MVTNMIFHSPTGDGSEYVEVKQGFLNKGILTNHFKV